MPEKVTWVGWWEAWARALRPKPDESVLRRRGQASMMVHEHWPGVPGHGECHETWTADCRAEANGFVLLRRTGPFRRLRRWRWLPRNGMFVRVHDVACVAGEVTPDV